MTKYIFLLFVLSMPVSAAEEKGPNNGRWLSDGDFSIELAIFEEGRPPEFRAWARLGDKLLPSEEIKLHVALTRLGGSDSINFAADGEHLTGDTVIYEPHSFQVEVNAVYKNQKFQWQYDNFEGRTRINEEMATALNLNIETAGPRTIRSVETVYGRLIIDPQQQRTIKARFDGRISSLPARLGDNVTKGQQILKIESNQSLNLYSVTAPISGVVTEKYANVGEQSGDRKLLVITDPRAVMAELSVYPEVLAKLAVGMRVKMRAKGIGEELHGRIVQIDALTQRNQTTFVRVMLDKVSPMIRAGLLLEADITILEKNVPIAVRTNSLQKFRDFTVVFAKFDTDYEVRMLEFGLIAGQWAEVTSGLMPNTEYVVENSYVIKADIEKSGASHDH